MGTSLSASCRSVLDRKQPATLLLDQLVLLDQLDPMVRWQKLNRTMFLGDG